MGWGVLLSPGGAARPTARYAAAVGTPWGGAAAGGTTVAEHGKNGGGAWNMR